jgi:hypothetical protein
MLTIIHTCTGQHTSINKEHAKTEMVGAIRKLYVNDLQRHFRRQFRVFTTEDRFTAS